MYHGARLGRLGRKKRGRYVGAWCTRVNNRNQWIKVDFSRPMKITKILTQGRQDASQWVTYYKVSSSLDGVHWQVYRFKNSDKVIAWKSWVLSILAKYIINKIDYRSSFYVVSWVINSDISTAYCYSLVWGQLQLNACRLIKWNGLLWLVEIDWRSTLFLQIRFSTLVSCRWVSWSSASTPSKS